MIRLVTLLVLVGVLSFPAHAKKAQKAVQDTSSNSMSFTEYPHLPGVQFETGKLHDDRRMLPPQKSLFARRLHGF